MPVLSRRFSSLSVAGAGVMALGLGACEPELGETQFETQVAVTTDAGMSDDDAALITGQGIPTMDGTWLMIHEQSICVETLGLNAEALSVTTEIITMTQDAGRVREEHRICSIALTKLLDIETVFPDVAAQSHQPIIITDSQVSGNEFGAGYASGVEAQLFGVQLEDPLADEVPESSDDPRVVDSDEDGQPAVTLLISGGAAAGGCDMYVIQRSAVRYFGLFERPNLITGGSTTFYTQKVMGATQSLCGVPRLVTPSDPHSRFELHRADGQGGSLNADTNGDGVYSCEEANALTLQLWTFREPDNTLCGGEN
jgi:hypothetical protein